MAVRVARDAREAFEAALGTVCDTVGFFRDHDNRTAWGVEGVKPGGEGEAELAAALAVAALVTGVSSSRSGVTAGGLAGADLFGVSRALSASGSRFAGRISRGRAPRAGSR